MEAPRVREAIVDCALVLKGTTLEAHGEPMVYKDDDGEEIPTLIVELRTGWFDRYQLHFFDFSQSEGIFPGGRDPQSEREERPLMVTADINVFARPCDIEPRPFICDLIKRETGRAFISERGVETDFMFDNDKGDTNNIISNSPELPPPGEEHHERTTDYSPLWKIWVVELSREHCWEWDLVDTTGSQGESDIRDVRTVFDLEEAGIVTREQMPEDEAGTAIPGNDGVVFFNCPNQVPLGHVPRSEILLREGMFTGRE